MILFLHIYLLLMHIWTFLSFLNSKIHHSLNMPVLCYFHVLSVFDTPITPPPKKKPFSFTLHSSKPWLSLKAYEDEQVFTFHPVYYQIWCVDLLSSLHSSSNSVVEETGLCSVKGMAVLKLFSPMNLSLTYQSSKIFSESSNLGSLLTRS